MKQLTILLMALLVSVCAMAEGGPKIVFEKTTADFGTIHKDNGRVAIEFKFENKGTTPLVIISANSACGCTQPKYPQEPVQPGDSGVITLYFNPAHQLGEINKTVTLRTNDRKKKKVSLRITGVVTN